MLNTKYNYTRTLLLEKAENAKMYEHGGLVKIGNELLEENDNKTKQLKHICALAKIYLTAQSYGRQLESIISTLLDLKKAPDDASGDASANIGNIEIKVSLSMDDEPIFHMVQIRPEHDISHFLSLCYDGYRDELFILLIPRDVVINVSKSTMAHGKDRTKSEVEYRVSFSKYGSDKKKTDTWKKLVKYNVSIEELQNKVWQKRK